MRIGCYHLGNVQISLRQLAHGSRLVFFAPATTAAARFLLLWLAATALTFVHSGGAFFRRRLLIGNVDHLRQFELFLLCSALSCMARLDPVDKDDAKQNADH